MARIEVTQLNDHIYLMDDNHEATGYIVIGKDKAAVIDTMNGYEDVKAVARRYTDLPLMVINTHGHPDHIYGNIYFDEAYVAPDDMDVADEFANDPGFLKMIGERGAVMPPFKAINPGETVDLGGLHLEVIALPGHTAGSILLLLKEDRILFTGDAINHHLWMQIPHSTSLEMFRDNLSKVMYLKDKADMILHGHARGFDSIDLMDHTLAAIDEILAGKTGDDKEYEWFDGISRQHPIPDDEGVICYNQRPAWVKEDSKAWSEGDGKRDEGLTEPEDVESFKDISYGVYGESNLLDVYYLKGTTGKLPILINVHGGGYFYGDKELYRFYAMDMARYGFTVVNMNYRLSPAYKYPAPLQDINNVMLWIEKHADEYHMDTENIFMMGDSAGAQLTSHYAAINSNPDFCRNIYMRKHSLKIKGISLACGMYDMKSLLAIEEKDKLFDNYLMSCYYNPDEPTLDVCGAITDKYPATYLFSCPNDFLYPACKPMADLINARGGKAVMKIYGTAEMKDVAHVFHCNMKTDIGREARKDQAEFLLGLCNK